MQTDVQVRKARGRLSRHVQNKLGETLHAMFDEIVKEGVPDRFSKLLEQINGGGGLHATRAGELDASETGPDSLVKEPEDKGSRS
ncbi:MAG TPA: NepR family anti-sigma factor [Xanthobacteraceae bacterium]|nr:NepR family anti-sigma factor [Xanthobacteraceae bacterium]